MRKQANSNSTKRTAYTTLEGVTEEFHEQLEEAIAVAPIAENSIVVKPSSYVLLTELKFYDVLPKVELPSAVFNYVTDSGGEIGAELIENSSVGSLTFTGSYGVGFLHIFRQFSRDYPRPCIVGMGGKNPAIVTKHADLEKAAEGIMHSAFGLGGQKHSACSRVYIESSVKEKFIKLLLEKIEKSVIGDSLDRKTYFGPVIHEAAYQNYQRYIEEAKQDGGEILAGGKIFTDGPYAYGYYVTPTIIDKLSKDHHFFREEFFLPTLILAEVKSLDEALELANDSVYGLTAGLYSEDKREIDKFIEKIQASVVYINRRAGATTSAWPGVQPFDGWKGSGSTGKNGGGSATYNDICVNRAKRS